MDIQLPVLDGYEATRRIKTDPNLKATPVIAVSSFAMKGDEDALRSAAARVLAIAAVHERLYTGEDASVVRLDTFLSDLCGEIGRACGCPDGITTDVQRADVPTDMAIPLALIVNELVTNVASNTSALHAESVCARREETP